MNLQRNIFFHKIILYYFTIVLNIFKIEFKVSNNPYYFCKTKIKKYSNKKKTIGSKCSKKEKKKHLEQ